MLCLRGVRALQYALKAMTNGQRFGLGTDAELLPDPYF
jgi:hypothetical protein